MDIITNTSALSNTYVLVTANGLDAGAGIYLSVLAGMAVLAFVLGWFMAVKAPLNRASL